MNQDFYNAVREKVKISQQRWVEWRHEVMGLLHCGACLSLHECWFVFENAPMAPLHEKCHCTTVAISTAQVKNNAKATSAYSKFDPYLFINAAIKKTKQHPPRFRNCRINISHILRFRRQAGAKWRFLIYYFGNYLVAEVITHGVSIPMVRTSCFKAGGIV